MATGVVWGRLELLDAMPPYHVGSNMAHEADFERSTFEHGALKFQAARLTWPDRSDWPRRSTA